MPYPAPKYSEYKNPLGKFSTRIFWDQDGILRSNYLPKGQTINAEYYSSLLVQLKDILKENAAGSSQRGSCSCTMSRITGHLQARRNWLTWASNVVITLPILRIWPLRTTTFYPELKKQLKGRHFSPRRRSLLPRRPGWKDNLLKFF